MKVCHPGSNFIHRHPVWRRALVPVARHRHASSEHQLYPHRPRHRSMQWRRRSLTPRRGSRPISWLIPPIRTAMATAMIKHPDARQVIRRKTLIEPNEKKGFLSPPFLPLSLWFGYLSVNYLHSLIYIDFLEYWSTDESPFSLYTKKTTFNWLKLFTPSFRTRVSNSFRDKCNTQDELSSIIVNTPREENDSDSLFMLAMFLFNVVLRLLTSAFFSLFHLALFFPWLFSFKPPRSSLSSLLIFVCSFVVSDKIPSLHFCSLSTLLWQKDSMDDNSNTRISVDTSDEALRETPMSSFRLIIDSFPRKQTADSSKYWRPPTERRLEKRKHRWR